MSGNTTMNFNATGTDNANDGTPQVSILASASAKRMQERRRRSRLLKGTGKKYPGVGTHHCNTKHVWLYSELAEVSAAYKEHHTTMPCWTIADMLYYSFSQQVEYYQAKVVQLSKVDDDDDQPICQLQEPRVHVPSIQAIQSKLMDCISLQHKDSLGYASQPTQMHKQVWEHLALAEKHRKILKQQPQLVQVAVKQEEQEEQEEQEQHPPTKSTRKLLRHDFLFSSDAEFETTLPPAKRRKVVFEDEDEEEESAPQQQYRIKQEEPDVPVSMSKAEFDAGINELMSLLGDSDHLRRQEHKVIQRLVNKIRDHNSQIGKLLGNMQDKQSEIKQHTQAIAQSMEQIESIIIPVPLPTPASTASTAPTPAPATMVCNKCTKTISASVGGFSVHYADSSHPQHGTIECNECVPLSPTSQKFLEDTNAEYEAMAAAATTATEHPEPEENYYDDSADDYDGYEQACYCGSNNCWFSQETNGGGRGEYDHSEECS